MKTFGDVYPFNRTIAELKEYWASSFAGMGISFNRTIAELKAILYGRPSFEAELLIVP